MIVFCRALYTVTFGPARSLGRLDLSNFFKCAGQQSDDMEILYGDIDSQGTIGNIAGTDRTIYGGNVQKATTVKIIQTNQCFGQPKGAQLFGSDIRPTCRHHNLKGSKT